MLIRPDETTNPEIAEFRMVSYDTSGSIRPNAMKFPVKYMYKNNVNDSMSGGNNITRGTIMTIVKIYLTEKGQRLPTMMTCSLGVRGQL